MAFFVALLSLCFAFPVRMVKLLGLVGANKGPKLIKKSNKKV